jgi:homoserine O-acetyltransferase
MISRLSDIKDKTTAGRVDTLYYTFGSAAELFTLENGESLNRVTLAYQTYGELNADKSNAILIVHALSGDAHAAGIDRQDESIGWWDAMIGPGKGFDTDRYFIICSNVIGGCMGTTGPSSIDPATGAPYGIGFPMITVGDMVKAQRQLISYLGIDKLLSVCGGSMGGMQVLSWMAGYPGMVRSVIPIATTIKHNPQQIAFNEVSRQAILSDPNWNNGNYYDGLPPSSGLSLARMVGHITYMSDASMAEKFGRSIKETDGTFKFKVNFTVEDYLHRRGANFVKRFDANSYLYITRAMDQFDAGNGKPLHRVIKGLDTKVLVIAFKSDWLYPAYQSREIVKECKLAGVDVTYCEVDSTYGHDAFLLEIEEESHLIKYFLKKVTNGTLNGR